MAPERREGHLRRFGWWLSVTLLTVFTVGCGIEPTISIPQKMKPDARVVALSLLAPTGLPNHVKIAVRFRGTGAYVSLSVPDHPVLTASVRWQGHVWQVTSVREGPFWRHGPALVFRAQTDGLSGELRLVAVRQDLVEIGRAYVGQPQTSVAQAARALAPVRLAGPWPLPAPRISNGMASVLLYASIATDDRAVLRLSSQSGMWLPTEMDILPTITGVVAKSNKDGFWLSALDSDRQVLDKLRYFRFLPLTLVYTQSGLGLEASTPIVVQPGMFVRVAAERTLPGAWRAAVVTASMVQANGNVRAVRGALLFLALTTEDGEVRGVRAIKMTPQVQTLSLVPGQKRPAVGDTVVAVGHYHSPGELIAHFIWIVATS